MAEKSTSTKTFGDNSEDDCAVCLQPCVYPMVLPCKHTFCFLCVKGLGRTTRNCAMCRQQFPLELLENPSLKCPVEETMDSGFEGGYQWFYEGRNGWWQYERRISAEIERAYKCGEKSIDIIICGELYAIDLEKNVQFPKQNPIKRRKIQRSSVGWWQYDERTGREIQNAHKNGCKILEVSIAGRVYVIDFENMEQRQKINTMKARRIKRDLVSVPKKGVSGIRTQLRTAFNEDFETRLAMLNLFGLQDE